MTESTFTQGIAPGADTQPPKGVEPTGQQGTQPSPDQQNQELIDIVSRERQRAEREGIRNSRMREVGVIGNFLLHKAIDRNAPKYNEYLGQGMSKDQIGDKDPTCYAIGVLAATTRRKLTPDAPHPQPYHLDMTKGGNALKVQTTLNEGMPAEEVTIVNIQSITLDKNGNTAFICEVRPTNNASTLQPVTFSQEQLMNIQLTNRRETFVNALSNSDQKELLSLQIDIVEGKTDGLDAQGLDQKIGAVATEAGMNTRERWETFIRNLDPMSIPGVGREGASRKELDEEAAPLKARAIALLGDRTMVDPLVAMEALGMLGMNSDSFKSQADVLTKSIERMSAQLKDMANDPRHEIKLMQKELAERIAEAQERQTFLQTVSEMLGKDGPFIEILQKMDDGTLTEEQTTMLREAFASGNINDFAEHVVRIKLGEKYSQEEIDARIEAQKEALLRRKKRVGPGLLWAILLPLLKEGYGLAEGQMGQQG